MKDRQAHLERLRNDAAECATLSRLALDEKKRELFADLSAHLTMLADEVERVIGPPRRNTSVEAADSRPSS